jgi:hypothetical protein
MPGTILEKGAELRAIGAARVATELPDLALGGLNVDLRCPVQLVPVTSSGHTTRRAGLRARRASLRSVFEANRSIAPVQLFGAASTMAAKLSAFRAAPPTNAPSMSGQASRALALSGLTLPP